MSDALPDQSLFTALTERMTWFFSSIRHAYPLVFSTILVICLSRFEEVSEVGADDSEGDDDALSGDGNSDRDSAIELSDEKEEAVAHDILVLRCAKYLAHSLWIYFILVHIIQSFNFDASNLPLFQYGVFAFLLRNYKLFIAGVFLYISRNAVRSARSAHDDTLETHANGHHDGPWAIWVSLFWSIRRAAIITWALLLLGAICAPLSPSPYSTHQPSTNSSTAIVAESILLYNNYISHLHDALDSLPQHLQSGLELSQATDILRITGLCKDIELLRRWTATSPDTNTGFEGRVLSKQNVERVCSEASDHLRRVAELYDLTPPRVKNAVADTQAWLRSTFNKFLRAMLIASRQHPHIAQQIYAQLISDLILANAKNLTSITAVLTPLQTSITAATTAHNALLSMAAFLVDTFKQGGLKPKNTLFVREQRFDEYVRLVESIRRQAYGRGGLREEGGMVRKVEGRVGDVIKRVEGLEGRCRDVLGELGRIVEGGEG